MEATTFLGVFCSDAAGRSGCRETSSPATTPLVIHIKREGKAAEVEKKKRAASVEQIVFVFFSFISLKQTQDCLDESSWKSWSHITTAYQGQVGGEGGGVCLCHPPPYSPPPTTTGSTPPPLTADLRDVSACQLHVERFAGSLEPLTRQMKCLNWAALGYLWPNAETPRQSHGDVRIA